MSNIRSIIEDIEYNVPHFVAWRLLEAGTYRRNHLWQPVLYRYDAHVAAWSEHQVWGGPITSDNQWDHDFAEVDAEMARHEEARGVYLDHPDYDHIQGEFESVSYFNDRYDD